MMSWLRTVTVFMLFLGLAIAAHADDVPISEASQECMDCHASITPGIVADWQRSRHARNH